MVLWLFYQKCLIIAKKGLKTAHFGVIKIGFVLCTLYTPNFFNSERVIDSRRNHTSICDCFGYKLWSSQFQNLIFEKKKSKIQFDQRKLMRSDWLVIKIIKTIMSYYWWFSGNFTWFSCDILVLKCSFWS